MENSRIFYDYIVVGCGGIGSATVYWLSKRAGTGVLGIEQFNLGHHNGGSQDHSRMVRLAYPDNRYTRLTPDTYKAWATVEEESGIKLVHNTGAIQLAKINDKDQAIDRMIRSMEDNNMSYTKMTGSELRNKFSQFEVDESFEALYQPIAGIIDAAMANSVHIQLARGFGATILEECIVQKVDKMLDGNIEVRTTKGTFQCRKLIVTAGAWINHILQSIGIKIPIIVTQEQLTYVATSNIKDFTIARFPIWSYHSPTHDFYGTPIFGISGCKVAIDAGGPEVTVESRSYKTDTVREQACINLLREIIPKAVGPIMYTKTCLYTMTPDRHFIVDDCSDHGWDNVIVCCGAGHGFKFACLLGKIMSEMAVDGRTQHDISMFNIGREALKNTNYNKHINLFSDTTSQTGTKLKLKL